MTSIILTAITKKKTIYRLQKTKQRVEIQNMADIDFYKHNCKNNNTIKANTWVNQYNTGVFHL